MLTDYIDTVHKHGINSAESLARVHVWQVVQARNRSVRPNSEPSTLTIRRYLGNQFVHSWKLQLTVFQNGILPALILSKMFQPVIR